MSIVANAARMIALKGETMELDRDGETPITVKGKRAAGSLDDVGNASQQRFRVRIAPTEIAASTWSPAAPLTTDRLVVAGRILAILDVEPVSDGGEIALYELDVAG